MRAHLTVVLGVLAACGGPIFGGALPETTLDPPPGPFLDELVVTLAADVDATIVYTTDGSDPLESSTRVEQPSPASVKLERTTTLRFYADARGSKEKPRDAQYIRAGGPAGTASGVIVVDTIAVGRALALQANGVQTRFDAVEAPAEVPFVVTGLGSGQHRLRAIADRDEDGNFLPVLDFASETYNFQLDLTDPFRSSVENVRLYLGASSDGLCTIHGTINVPNADLGESVSIAALGGDAFSGNVDPMALLAQLQNGYQVFARDGTDEYPYAITDLEPGLYLPVPLRTTFGAGGLGLNLLANPLSPVRCRAGDTKRVDYGFGVARLTGKVTVEVDEPPAGFTWGIVAAKQTTLLAGIQAVLMPVILSADAEAGTLSTRYAGSGLRRGSFSVRVFTSLDEGNPLTGALGWVVNPLSTEQPHATVSVGLSDVELDIDL